MRMKDHIDWIQDNVVSRNKSDLKGEFNFQQNTNSLGISTHTYTKHNSCEINSSVFAPAAPEPPTYLPVCVYTLRFDKHYFLSHRGNNLLNFADHENIAKGV